MQRKSQAKITKVGAGYVYREGAEYRCDECWKFIPSRGKCAEIRSMRIIRPNGYCIQWSKGKPGRVSEVYGDYAPEEVGYGEKPEGTLCRRCDHFDGTNRCEVVGKNDPEIKPGACCDNQEPK